MYAYFAKIIDETLYTLFGKVPSLPKKCMSILCVYTRKKVRLGLYRGYLIQTHITIYHIDITTFLSFSLFYTCNRKWGYFIFYQQFSSLSTKNYHAGLADVCLHRCSYDMMITMMMVNVMLNTCFFSRRTER